MIVRDGYELDELETGSAISSEKSPDVNAAVNGRDERRDVETKNEENLALRASGVVKRFEVQDGNRRRKGLRRLWPFGRRETFEALSCVSIEVRAGEIYGLIGMNGSGKSTFIRVISTLLFPDEGTVEVFGVDVVKNPDEVRRMINRVSVDAAFFRSLSAKENLRYSARLHGLSPRDARKRYKEILTRIGFDHNRVSDQVKSLSRGMKQKVAVSRALMSTPRLLLLDEPTTGLDPRSKRDVQQFLHKMRDEEGTTIVITTHDMEEAERICDRIAIIHDGRIVAEGTAAELIEIARNGRGEPTLEKVFFKFTGEEWDEYE
jgi:ABC-2 type transport system ATP-binding protein